MRLADIDKRGFDVFLLQTNSTKMELFLQDRLRRKYNADKESVIDVQKSSTLSEVHQLIGVVPPFSDKWFVRVDCKKVDLTRLSNIIRESTTCVFFLLVDNYRLFKDIKDKLNAVPSLTVVDFYLNYLRRYDIIYLYDAFVPMDKRLQPVLFDSIVQGYSGDIDSLFDIFQAVGSAEEGTVWTRGKIAEIGGIGGLSIESYIFSLLKPLSGSEKGLKRVMKLRLEAGKELGGIYGWGTFYRYLRSAIMQLVDLKMLLISGVVYRAVRDIPKGYDIGRLTRYQKYIWRLNEIPLSNLLRLVKCVGADEWSGDADFLEFYYTFIEKQVLSVCGIN